MFYSGDLAKPKGKFRLSEEVKMSLIFMVIKKPLLFKFLYLIVIVILILRL